MLFCAQCCGNEKWGDWRPHLAVMLSNETGDPTVQQKAIITMGDTLGTDSALTDTLTGCNVVSAQKCELIVLCCSSCAASKGLLYAAHVCYLTAGVPFGGFTQKAERLVLLGSSHR